MTIHPVGDVDRQTDGETDMMKLTVTVCNFVNSPKKCFVYKSERKPTGKKFRRYGKTVADGDDGMLDNKYETGNISKAGGGRGGVREEEEEEEKDED